ncbi:NfeD family protein [Rhodopirellula sallentina]|uniref:Nodulation efficiency, NfeD n=1 Tax=Rhodopirellula sallentina SM41 TaxID=1263870 RepID=M5U9C3_9BACT|nr:NfeD family protein [Rhodopirellula sallentina]EMI57884.1 Nodulation efficiency, NfeD [Rhodopirellula sallentina SM41]
MPAFYAIALLVAFYALIAAEILIPSGGILGLTAAVVGVTSIIIGCTYSITMGMTLLLVYLITTPIVFAILIRLWPTTRIGRQMLNRDTLQSDTTLPPATTLDGTPLIELVGRIGVAMSNLLPSGQVKVDGHKTDAVSTGLPIDAGTHVMVVRVNAGKLQVRQASPDEIAGQTTQPSTFPASSTAPASSIGPVTSTAPAPSIAAAETPDQSLVVDSTPPTTESSQAEIAASPLDDIDLEILNVDAQTDDESDGAPSRN